MIKKISVLCLLPSFVFATNPCEYDNQTTSTMQGTVESLIVKDKTLTEYFRQTKINKNYFKFNSNFISQIFKIIISNIIAISIFYFLINFLDSSLNYVNTYKFIYVLLIVSLTFISYIGVSIIIKAFKISDINLKY